MREGEGRGGGEGGQGGLREEECVTNAKGPLSKRTSEVIDGKRTSEVLSSVLAMLLPGDTSLDDARTGSMNDGARTGGQGRSAGDACPLEEGWFRRQVRVVRRRVGPNP